MAPQRVKCGLCGVVLSMTETADAFARQDLPIVKLDQRKLIASLENGSLIGSLNHNPQNPHIGNTSAGQEQASDLPTPAMIGADKTGNGCKPIRHYTACADSVHCG
ncbi:MAG: hypothetical protein ACO1RT_08245 [Planctomycetaceae bacterium]